MRALTITAVFTALLTLAAHALAILAVEVNAAGALLSPAGTMDPVPWLVAGSYAIARFGSVAAICATLALAAALVAARALKRRDPP